MPSSRPSPVTGKLVKVDGKNLVIDAAGRDGQARQVSIATDDSSEFNVNFESGNLTDLKPGMMVNAMPRPAQASQPGKLIVAAIATGRMGLVVRVEGKSLVLQVLQPGNQLKEITADTDEKTKVILFALREIPKAGTLEDIKPGMTVTVLPETGTAEKILVGPGRVSPMPASRPAPVNGF